MKIKKITEKEFQAYDAEALDHGSLFDTRKWGNLFGKNVTHYGILDEGENLTGGFYIYKEKKLGISLLCNPPLTPAIGPFFKCNAENPARLLEKHKQISAALAQFIESVDCSIKSVAFDKRITDMQPFIWKNFKVVPQYTYIIDLGREINDIWKDMSGERRKNILKGGKDGLEVKKIIDYSAVYLLVEKTFKRQTKGFNSNIIKKVLFEFADGTNSFAFTASAANKPIACTFCVHDSKTSYYLLGGYDDENKHHGAGAMCMWESIKYSKSLGISQFDFEGSMVPAIEKYFRGFGGKLTPYYRINKASLPLEIALKFFKRGFF